MTDGGRQLLDLSMDDEPFEQAGKRYEMPKDLRTMLMDRVANRVLLHCQDGSDSKADVCWKVKDATVVRYEEGDSQVPHVDPVDATLLIYLDDGTKSNNQQQKEPLKGGDTCFPMLGSRIPVHLGRTLLFFSTEFCSGENNTDTGNRERDVMSLHHGGRLCAGSKVVAQIMLYLETAGVEKSEEDKKGSSTSSSSSAPPPFTSWLDLVASHDVLE